MVRLPFAWAADSPLIDALHVYEIQIARRALALTITTQEEDPAMSTTTPPRNGTTPTPAAVPPHLTPVNTPVSTPVSEPVDINQLAKIQEALMTVMLGHADFITELQEKVTKLQEKVAELASTHRPKAAPDDTNNRIVAYLRDCVPGVWLTPGSVAVNLDMDGKAVAGRLERMSRDVHPRVERKGGRGVGTNPLYRVVPPPKPQPESDDGH